MVDELLQFVQLDFKFRASWKDARWNIPELFNGTTIDADYASNGIGNVNTILILYIMVNLLYIFKINKKSDLWLDRM